MAQAALEANHLDRVVFIPCRRSPHKSVKAPVSGDHRVRMIRRVLKSLKRFRVSRVELDRKEASYSYLTARHFAEKYPEAGLFWIMGSDQWESLEKWKNFETLAGLVTFIVFPRPHLPEPREGIGMNPLDVRIDVSASMIRKRIRSGISTQLLLPMAVENYIAKHGLYQNTK